MARVLGVARPRYAIVENPPGLLDRGLGQVLGSLAALGYDAEWGVFSACQLGAPHTRERVLVVAYPEGHMGAERLGILDRVEQSLSALDHGARAEAWLATAPDVRGMADGSADWLQRLEAIGNSFMPAWAERLGRAILEADGLT